MAKKILIADDEEDIKVVTQLFLESKGYEIVTAYDGLDALDKVKSEKPDAVLLDIMMPLIDGFEVCQRMKEDPELAGIPVVMMSASTHSESRQRGLDAGAVDFLIKPFQPEVLEKLLQTTLA